MTCKVQVSQSALAFGFSRPTYYQAETDFQRDGVMGLLPEKRGPRQGHKLTSEVLDFAAQLRASDPSAAYEELREQAVGSSNSGGLGMALFLGRGMVAWMHACSWGGLHYSRQRAPVSNR
jgi:hypothetical protein